MFLLFLCDCYSWFLVLSCVCAYQFYYFFVVFIVCRHIVCLNFFFFFKQKTAYDLRFSDWSSDVCSSDLMVVIGGMGTLVGPLIGALLVYTASEVLRDVGNIQMIVFAFLVIVFARYFREGLWGLLRRSMLRRALAHRKEA